jgi:sortase A
MTRSLVLLWIERALLLAGVALGAWCLGVLAEARFTARLALPAVATARLPGDANDNAPAATGRAPDVVVRRAPPPAGTLLGRLEAPSLRLSAAVLEGSDDATLGRGAGHIEDTALPGDAGNVGIAGHRDTVFRPLRAAKAGDAIDLTTADRVYHYRISRTAIVNPDDVYVLDPTPQRTLTLVTCYPFEFIGHAPRRFIVQAELVSSDLRVAQ